MALRELTRHSKIFDYNLYKRENFASLSLLFVKNFTFSSQKHSDNSTTLDDFKSKLSKGPNFIEFIKTNPQIKFNEPLNEKVPYIDTRFLSGNGRKVFFQIYGCQMNVNDAEVMWSVLKNHNYVKAEKLEDADVIFLITCAIRDSAEEKIWNKLNSLKGLKKIHSKTKPPLKIGLVGCMAERLKEKIIEKDELVDLVVGPDAYRDLPRLLALTESGQKSINVLLSYDETYADIIPVRMNENLVTAYISIMRGCDNMCTYCIVPWTRGKERSRPIASILKEVEELAKKGVKDITLLGQNVNSYRDLSESKGEVSLIPQPTAMSKGFHTVYKPKLGGLRFSHLLEKVANIDPEIRIRFTSPHPKDFPDDLLYIIRDHDNVCKNLHLPAQSGNSEVLKRMRRGYSREAYLELIEHVRKILPDVGLSSDFICGFCGETDDEFQETLSLIDQVKYNMAFLFAYSMREKTTAHRKFKDDVPPDVKQARLLEMIKLFRHHVDKINKEQIGQIQVILVEGPSKRSANDLVGRNDKNNKVIISNNFANNENNINEIKAGDYVAVEISDANSQVLKGIPLYKTTLRDGILNLSENKICI